MFVRKRDYEKLLTRVEELEEKYWGLQREVQRVGYVETGDIPQLRHSELIGKVDPVSDVVERLIEALGIKARWVKRRQGHIALSMEKKGEQQ